VSVNTIEWDDYYGTVPGAVRAGEGPHVGIMHINEVATAAARGVILPLDDLATTLDWEASDFSPAVWEAGIYDDQRYGIPLDVHPLGFYYNRALMEEAGLDPDDPPSTSDEYLAALDALRDAGIDGHWVGPDVSWWYQGLIAQFGGSLYNDDVTEVTWNSDAGVEALEWLVNLIDEGYSPQDVGAGTAVSAFEAGDVAFVWNGVWFIAGLQEQDDFDWAVAPVPVAGDEPGVWASSHNFVLMNLPDMDDDTRMASYVFMNWVSAESLQWAEAGQIPARASVRESDEFQALEHQATVAEQLDYVVFQPSVPGIADVSAEMDQALEEAILGVKTPQEALDDAAVRGNELLQQNREQYGDWAAGN
jgi:multiple sugar transport system substrate-binding protein